MVEKRATGVDTYWMRSADVGDWREFLALLRRYRPGTISVAGRYWLLQLPPAGLRRTADAAPHWLRSETALPAPGQPDLGGIYSRDCLVSASRVTGTGSR